MDTAQTTRLLDRPFDARLIAKFNDSGPYYSSYPVLGEWHNGVGHEDYVRALGSFLRENPDAPLYFYLHTPFCAQLCWYCICNIQISSNRERIQRFVDSLLGEIRLFADFVADLGIRPNIREIHLGGGTPSHLDHAQLSSLVDAMSQFADIGALDEFAMEIDPRTVTLDDLRFYKGFGVDRISFGVQDFDAGVQAKINRIQPFDMVRGLLTDEVRNMFRGVNFDLLYGLPMQTRETFRRTVELTCELSPDRITLIKYAHVPDVRKHMRMIDAAELPPADDLPLMFCDAAQALTDDGYVWVGIDNFARPHDDLARAALAGKAGRNFSGSSPGRADNVIGVGPTVTSTFGRHYFQSAYDPRDYASAIDGGRFPITVGYELSDDEALRREIIFALQCRQRVDFTKFENAYGIDFAAYFGRELDALEPFVADGMVSRGDSGFSVTTKGRFFVRHVCRLFDRFLADGADYKIHGP